MKVGAGFCREKKWTKGKDDEGEGEKKIEYNQGMLYMHMKG